MNKHVDGNEQFDREFADLIAEIRVVKPEPEESFTTRLDARADEGFPKPAPAKVARSGREDSLRRVLAPLVASLAAIVLVVIGTSNLTDSFTGGGDSGVATMDVATTEAMEETAEDAASEFFEGSTEAEPTESAAEPVSGGTRSSADGSGDAEPEIDRAGRGVWEAASSAPEESPSSPPSAINYGSEAQAADDESVPLGGERQDQVPVGLPNEETTPPTAEPLNESLADESPARETQILPIILIAAGILLLIPALWFSTVNLRRRYRERVLDW